MRKTKIICTIGPASRDERILKKMILGGMDIARINTSHSSADEVEEMVGKIRRISHKFNKNTAIMLDLQGSKIRVGKLENKIKLSKKQKVIFTTDNNYKSGSEDNYNVIKVAYDRFIDDIKEGCRIFINDGLVECRVKEIDRRKNIAVCEVVTGGVVESYKGINLPGITISADSITRKDMEFLDLGIKLGVDFVAQSFVRNSADVEKIKRVIHNKKSHIMLVAKIEKHEAVNNFDDILNSADAIMVARGDLGIEVNAEDIPYLQKEIIKKSNMAGKPVVTATQMLDSMMRNPRPTRAEVSDVANAIIDGSDAVMLSGETAVGEYPLESLEMLTKIINKTEISLDYDLLLRNINIRNKKLKEGYDAITGAISFASCEIAHILNAKAIISATESGHTARQVSKNKPKSMIIGASSNDWVIRQLMISWGVVPVKVKPAINIDMMLNESVNVSKGFKYVNTGDCVVITAGVLLNKPGSTNLINVKIVE
ncbi:MAG: pyruvate kinase [Candidatus Humimicrobiaceae bacterium]|jgi:pyruvate kinase|nr:pyruvate kinase [Actinomycetota bacterium]MDD5601325.1 pyruvate kinase [Actinomycetota bacterium]MDY0027588.1 pyruvate kinase [Candidatus Humimicrobiaceae bacterium]